MKIKSVNLEAVCGINSVLPVNRKAEFAFAGKSNVGKSSLINSIMNRKAYAKTSSQPGKTQTINYYNINDAFYLVDLPGYGFASVSEDTKIKWGDMIENYLHTSRQLKQVFLLIDIRHEPGENDKNMYEWIIYQGFTPVIIATKSDKLKPSQIAAHVQMLRDSLRMSDGIRIIPFSAQSKDGLAEIYSLMEDLIDDYEEDVDDIVDADNYVSADEGKAAPAKLKDGKVVKGPRVKGKKKWENPDGTSRDKRLRDNNKDENGNPIKKPKHGNGNLDSGKPSGRRNGRALHPSKSKSAKAEAPKKKRTIRHVHKKKS